MSPRLKSILLILPVLGLILGRGYAYVEYNGLLERWHFVGQPGETVARIIGIKQGRGLVVATETGETYSLGLYERGELAIPAQLSWQKEGSDTVDTISYRDLGADFIALPPPFRAEQLYELEYVYKVSGNGQVNFALAPDGNIWMWKHEKADLASLVFYFYPVEGFLLGSAVSLLVVGVNWISEERQPRRAAHSTSAE